MRPRRARSNRRTVQRFLAGTHSNDLADLRVIDETVNEEIVCHGFPGFNATDREGYKEWFRFFRGPFSNMAFEPATVAST